MTMPYSTDPSDLYHPDDTAAGQENDGTFLVHPKWSSDIPGTVMATEPVLSACGDGRVVPSGLDGASGAARQRSLLRKRRCRHPRMHGTSARPRRARPVRRSCDLTLAAGFTLRNWIKEPKDSTLGKGIDHWLSRLRRRRPRSDPDPARLDKPATTRS
jgi:hypothetical protein